MNPRRISILGSTGSIGRNTLDVLGHCHAPEEYEIVALTGRNNVDLLARQAIEHDAKIAVTAYSDQYSRLKSALSGSGIEAAAGETAMMEAASMPADWTMAGIVGIAGLAPTLSAARAGSTIALANKECLVSAGQYFLDECESAGVKILPVDSEHNAIFQVFEERNRKAVERLILTASGGPFRDWPVERMARATPEAAASHPNWSMGTNISIDSATMFNKALEMIEAHHLFDMPADKIEVVVHPQSVVHSMVAYADGSVLAQMGCPDMRTAIGYTLAWPHRTALPVDRLDFAALSRLDFAPPDQNRFPAIRLARAAMAAGGLAPAVLNSAKEAALEAFIGGKIGFLDIARIVERALDRLDYGNTTLSLDSVLQTDADARGFVRSELQSVL